MNTPESRTFQKNAMEAAIRIAVVGTLVVWTYHITKPFIMPIIWGVIIAIAVEPFIALCSDALGGRRKLVSILFALIIIVALLVPVVKLSASSVKALQPVLANMDEIHITIPPPPASVHGWPIIGPYVSKLWSLASTNLVELLRQFEPQLKMAFGYLLSLIKGGVKAVFIFMISLAIAAAILATYNRTAAATDRILRRFAGEKAPELRDLATATIRAVMLGVVGVAVIQSVLAAAGMIVVGVPLAGLWAVLVLVCAVIQLPAILVLGPVAAWVFMTKDSTTVSVLFLIWCILVGTSDNFLKPIFMGRGVNIPMPVILLGALGGMMLSGIIGLFIGAVIVAISYTLFMAWVDEVDSLETVPALNTEDDPG